MTAIAVHPAYTVAGTTRLRLTRRGRAVVLAVIVSPLVAIALLAQLNGGVATATNDGSTSFDYVTVQGGQSLWQLAVEVAPSADPRDVIADIMALNRLASVAVEPGQRLAIPFGYSE